MTGPARDDGGAEGAEVVIFRRPPTPEDMAREIVMAFPGWHVWCTPGADTWNAHREGEKPFFGRRPGSSHRFMVSAYDAPGLIALLKLQDPAVTGRSAQAAGSGKQPRDRNARHHETRMTERQQGSGIMNPSVTRLVRWVSLT